MSKQDWSEGDESLEEILKEKKGAINQAHQTFNTARYYSILLESIQEALQDKYQKDKAPRTRSKPY